MKRVMLRVAYDGTDYSGWQVQPNGRTIEGELNRALSELTGEAIKVIGASRTDAGVHSMGNVAVFDTESPIPAEKFGKAIQGRLPEDIVIVDAVETRADFHPRHCDHEKTYEYRFYTGAVKNPQLSRYTAWHYGKLDLEAMKKAAQALTGAHDFTSFCAVATDVEDKVRTIYELTVEPDGDLIRIRVCGSGFLYNMVRIIAGTLLHVGLGRIMPEAMAGILEGKDRRLAGPTAPACGLTQVHIEYHDIWKKEEGKHESEDIILR